MLRKRLGGGRSGRTSRVQKHFSDANIERAPSEAGAYVLYSQHGTVTYVGASASLRDALLRHKTQEDVPSIGSFAIYPTSNLEKARAKQHELIDRYNPRYNLSPVS